MPLGATAVKHLPTPERFSLRSTLAHCPLSGFFWVLPVHSAPRPPTSAHISTSSSPIRTIVLPECVFMKCVSLFCLKEFYSSSVRHLTARPFPWCPELRLTHCLTPVPQSASYHTSPLQLSLTCPCQREHSCSVGCLPVNTTPGCSQTYCLTRPLALANFLTRCQYNL